MGLLAGIKTCSYVGSSPTNGLDPLGLWSPGGHDALYDYAFNLLLDPTEVAIIQQESRELYKETGIGTQYAYIHSVRKPLQSPAAAKAASKNYFYEKLRQARNDPDREKALRDFADAAHTITDYFSPEHTDAQGNPRLWFQLLFARHSPNDNVGHETVHDITPRIYQQAMAAPIAAYNQAFGNATSGGCGCQ